MINGRWSFWPWVVCLLLVALLGSLGRSHLEAGDKPPRKWNVLMIAIDDLNDWVGHLGGHPQTHTPAIDRLAARGTAFTNAHCQAPLCNPSRTSLLTGLRPSTTGVYGLAPWFRQDGRFRDHVTLPQHFMRAGYEVVLAGKIWHGPYPPRSERKAEAHAFGPPARVGTRPPHKLVPPTPAGNHPLVDWGTFPHRPEDRGDWQLATWAVKRIERGFDRPFFLAVGFFLPHVPCYAPPEIFRRFPREEMILPPVRDDDRRDTPPFSWYLHWRLPEPRLSWLRRNREWRHLVQAYLASVHFVDRQVQRVLDALDASPYARDTIVVLWSDHGWHLGEKGITGKNSLWERSTHVPLIFAGPGIARQARCDAPVELLDVFPTLIELCGLPRRDDLEGHSLMPQLRDAQAPRRWPAITTHNQGNHAVRTRRWRYIRYADGSEELYDMERDPNEWTNLAGRAESEAIIAKLGKWLPKRDRPPMTGSRHRILVRRGNAWYWEGRPIVPAERLE